MEQRTCKFYLEEDASILDSKKHQNLIQIEAKTNSRSKKKSCAFVQLQQFLKSSCAPIY